MKVYGKTSESYTPDSKEHLALFIKPQKSVTVIKSMMIEGIRRDNGKHWTRWQPQYKIGFYKTSKGNVVPFYTYGKTFTSPHMTLRTLDPDTYGNPLRHDTELNARYIAALRDELGITTLADIFPIASLKGIEEYIRIPQTLIHAMRQPDIMSFTREVFGACHYRKDLVRTVAESNRTLIAIAAEFRGLVPTDWLIRFMKDSYQAYTMFGNVTGLRKILLKQDLRTYRRLLMTSATSADMTMAEDMCSIYRAGKKRGNDFPDATRRMESFRDMHDFYVGHQTYTKIPRVNEDIPKTMLAKAIDGLEFGGYKIVMAKDTDTMNEWSAYMRNCIGGYGAEAVDKSSTFGAVVRDDRIIANFQVTRNVLKQLLGRFNNPLNESDRYPIEVKLREFGINCDRYWGQQPIQDTWDAPRLINNDPFIDQLAALNALM